MAKKKPIQPPNAKVKESSKSGSGWVVYLAIGVLIAAIVLGTTNQNESEPSGSKPKVMKRRLSAYQIKERRKSLECKNRHTNRDCDQWASEGGCDTAPGWMSVYCGASCGDCDLLDPHIRCDADRIGYTPVAAFKPGSVKALFESIPERFPEYNVTYLSKPPKGLYVLRFDNFLTDEEVDALIDRAGNLRRSTDQGGVDEDGVQEQVLSAGRTSENSWCDDACEADPLVRGVSDRISKVTGVPSDNFESFQVLRYQIGQQYVRHHDMGPEDNNLLCGPRILTFFLYLSDVEEGGGTMFTDLKPPITMMPKKGSAILWPSVLDSDPTIQDPLAYHHAMPVIKGVKFAANHWIHLYDYRTPNLWGCTGSFTEIEED